MKIVAGEEKKSEIWGGPGVGGWWRGGQVARVGPLQVAWWGLECHNSGHSKCTGQFDPNCLGQTWSGQTSWPNLVLVWPNFVLAKLGLGLAKVGLANVGHSRQVTRFWRRCGRSNFQTLGASGLRNCRSGQ